MLTSHSRTFIPSRVTKRHNYHQVRQRPHYLSNDWHAKIKQKAECQNRFKASKRIIFKDADCRQLTIRPICRAGAIQKPPFTARRNHMVFAVSQKADRGNVQACNTHQPQGRFTLSNTDSFRFVDCCGTSSSTSSMSSCARFACSLAARHESRISFVISSDSMPA